MKKISFLIPSKNRLNLLDHVIKSILIQPFSNYEIIVVDNCSSENYEAYVRGLNNAKITYFRQKNPVPVTENWQKALLLASGDYVLMLGDDDALSPEFFNLINPLLENESPDLIYLSAFHYCYPGVMPGCDAGYVARVKSEFLREKITPFHLDLDYARELSDAVLNFRHRFNFNAQHFLLRKGFVNQFNDAGGLYQSPYPDFFAAILIFHYAKSILVLPQESVIIGISPKSFGAYYFSNRHKDGYKFLQNEEVDPSVQEFVLKNEFPGDMNNTNWLISAEMARCHLPFNNSTEVNIERYKAIQILSLLRNKFWHQSQDQAELDDIKNKLTESESMLFSFLQMALQNIVQQDKNLIIPMLEKVEQQVAQYPAGFYQMVDIGAHHNISDLILWLSQPPGQEIILSKFDNHPNTGSIKKMAKIKSIAGKTVRSIFPKNGDRIVQILKRGPTSILASIGRKVKTKLTPEPPSTGHSSSLEPISFDGHELQISIRRGGERCVLSPGLFDDFDFKDGDEITIIPEAKASSLLRTPEGNLHLVTADGTGIRVPSRVELTPFKGYMMPEHLVRLTGAGSATFDELGQGHIKNYQKYMGIESGMSFLEIASGMARDAFPLIELLGPNGKYVGIDVQRESIVWCQKNITRKHPNFEFVHFNAYHELHNPFGTKTTMDYPLPVADRSVDRIGLQSLLTHIFEDEVVHYLKEIARVLKPNGVAYVTFLLYSEEVVAASRINDCTPYGLRFEHQYADGCYINNLQYPTGGVAFTAEKMNEMIKKAGLKLTRPFLRGYWSGFYENPDDDGQDVALLTPDI
ncbi:glycosyltransferase [Polynucleobacter sp. JS-Fieb-80-E5]|uniref:glycosyltransferase n=1 Tax=Polynucleobacter sp. JS-Fieb-80-E5 TaxID=2081050 RepID=UPI001C0B4467|nr:glycosyltransferase [Polynucleobacter sp. JS-Fieb-80-E5]MBU3619955.1 glycosyltransferase [Polynucleobacter sp. JS-Fieb-80-E5]